jgi:cell division protein FtsB
MYARPVARPFRRLILPALTAAYLGYFGFHALHGSYGLLARTQFEAQAVELEDQLADLQAEHDALEIKAALLRPENLDPDMLDEWARRNLNVIAPNEFVLIP